MMLWPNLQTNIIGMHADEPRYRTWIQDETARLLKDWRRETSRIPPQHLQPLIYKPEAVLAGILHSDYAASGGGGLDDFIADYVVNRDGVLRLGFSHTFLSQLPDPKRGRFTVGEPVQAAGQIHYGGGRIQRINNLSGHYKPNVQSPSLLENAFSKAQLRAVLPAGRTFAQLYSDEQF